MAKKKEKKEKKIINSFEDARSIFEDKFGEGSIMSLADNYKIKCDVIPSQSMSLDIAMGVGGYPKGRIIEIYGPEASGKTTLALHAVASAQKLGGKAVFIDAEHAISPQLMMDMGIDPELTMVSQPDSGEQALEMCEMVVENNIADLCVVDSVAALVPRAELEGDVGDNVIGAQARMMSQFLRRITSKVKNGDCSVIFINQIRHKIGIMFGSPETTSGGNALKFYSSVRLDIRRKEVIKAPGAGKDDPPIGHIAKVKVVKNKVASPFKTAEVPLIYGKGIDFEQDLLTVAGDFDIISKKGSHHYFNDNALGNGALAASIFLKDNPDITKQIDEAVREKLFAEDKNIIIIDSDAEDENLDQELIDLTKDK
jgi:recombination protein RecA